MREKTIKILAKYFKKPMHFYLSSLWENFVDVYSTINTLDSHFDVVFLVFNRNFECCANEISFLLRLSDIAVASTFIANNRGKISDSCVRTTGSVYWHLLVHKRLAHANNGGMQLKDSTVGTALCDWSTDGSRTIDVCGFVSYLHWRVKSVRLLCDDWLKIRRFDLPNYARTFYNQKQNQN